MTVIVFVLVNLFFYFLGFYSRTIYRVSEHIYYRLKLGVCFHYKGTGFVENRNGTISQFCINCGYPAGYHRWF